MSTQTPDATEAQTDLFGDPIQLPPGKRRLVDASVSIAADQPDDINYQHSILCQVGLPRSKLKTTTFERRSQNAILSVEAGKLFDGKDMVQQFVPMGRKPGWRWAISTQRLFEPAARSSASATVPESFWD